MRYLFPLLFLFACNTESAPAGNGLGPYEFVAPMDVQPIYTWGDDMAAEYADSLQELAAEKRYNDSMDAGYQKWIDSIAKASGE